MKFIPTHFEVIHFNIDGFLKISNEYLEEGKYSYILQKNQIDFNTQWQFDIENNIAHLTINAIYEPIKKVDYSKLASYKIVKTYIVTEFNNLENEKDEFYIVSKSLHEEMSKSYNERIVGTKVNIPFPIAEQQQLNHFSQHAILYFHKSLESLNDFLKN